MTVLISDEVLSDARRRLLSRSVALRSTEIPSTLILNFTYHQIRSGISIKTIQDMVSPKSNDTNGTPAIYRLKVLDAYSAGDLIESFLGKNQNLNHKYSRYNSITDTDTDTLYVGSSHNIASRLKQHLNSCAQKTYALKMNHWIPNGNGEVRVEVAMLQKSVGSSLVQDIEDSLWRFSRPVFGKFGPK